METVKRQKRHGKSSSRIYRIWVGMKRRCSCKDHWAYKHYGGRGIVVCKEWADDFTTFYEWAMSHGYTDELTIERIDVNGNYCPENCTWIPMKEQAYNKRSNHNIRYGKEEKTITEWSKEIGIRPHALYGRLQRGWDTDKALTTGSLRHDVLITHNGETLSLVEWSAKTGIPKSTISNRLKRGWAVDKALDTPSKKGVRVSYNGQDLTINEWSKKTGIPTSTLINRLKFGWELDRVFCKNNKIGNNQFNITRATE